MCGVVEGRRELGRALEARLGLDRERAIEERVERRRELAPHAARSLVALEHLRRADTRAAGASEGPLACERLVRSDREPPEIGELARRSAIDELLGRHVGGRA